MYNLKNGEGYGRLWNKNDEVHLDGDLHKASKVA